MLVPSPVPGAREKFHPRMLTWLSPQVLHIQLPGGTWSGWGLPWGVGSCCVGTATAHAQEAFQVKVQGQRLEGDMDSGERMAQIHKYMCTLRSLTPWRACEKDRCSNSLDINASEALTPIPEHEAAIIEHHTLGHTLHAHAQSPTSTGPR